MIRGDSKTRRILPNIGSQYLAAREIYCAYLAANANALLPRLTVPRGVESSLSNGIPKGEERRRLPLADVSRQDVPVWEPVSARRRDSS